MLIDQADLHFFRARVAEVTHRDFKGITITFNWTAAVYPGNLYISIKHAMLRQEGVEYLKKQYQILEWECQYRSHWTDHVATFVLQECP
jgi:hypothetical protein